MGSAFPSGKYCFTEPSPLTGFLICMILQEIKKKKAFLLDTNEWFHKTSGMDHAERAIFFELMFFRERNGYLPSEITRLARVSNITIEEFIPAWENIKYHFDGMLKKRRQSEWITPPKWNGSYYDIENRPGVYVIRTFLGNHNIRRSVVYVGEAKNLRKRLKCHEVDKLLNENGIYSCCKIKYCDNRHEFETELIKKIKPIFNIQHNMEFVKNIYLNHVIGELKHKKQIQTEN